MDEKFLVDTESLLGQFLSPLCLFIDPISCTTAQQTNSYARSTMRIAQAMDTIYAITHFSHRQQTGNNAWIDINSAHRNIFMAHLMIMRLVQKAKD